MSESVIHMSLLYVLCQFFLSVQLEVLCLCLCHMSQSMFCVFMTQVFRIRTCVCMSYQLQFFQEVEILVLNIYRDLCSCIIRLFFMSYSYVSFPVSQKSYPWMLCLMSLHMPYFLSVGFFLPMQESGFSPPGRFVTHSR